MMNGGTDIVLHINKVFLNKMKLIDYRFIQGVSHKPENASVAGT